MATIGNSNPTLLDIETRSDPDGKIARRIIEQLARTDGILDDMTFEQCNDGSGHKTTIRTGIPDGTWRQMYGGVQETKSTTAQVRDACGMHENYSTIDKAAATLVGGKAEWFDSEEAPFRLGMKNGVVSSLFYGDTRVNPERFMGIGPRFNTTIGVANSDNIIKAGGAGADNTSIYIVAWHPMFAQMIYPNGSNAGLFTQDLGEQTVYDSTNKPFQAYRTHYKWDVGFSVRDWRGIVRIPNISVGALTKTGSSGADLVDLIIQGMELLPEEVEGLGARVGVYCNRTVRSFLRRQMINKTNHWLTEGELFGKKVVMVDGKPLRRCDSILSTEALVP